MGEVDLRLAARWMDLLEEDLAIGTVECTPVSDPSLQGAELTQAELPGMSLFQ